MSAGVRDIVQLKLQKKLLEEQLKLADNKIDRLGDILHKKTHRNPSLANPEDNRLTSIGRTVSEFRLSPRSVKAQGKESLPNIHQTQQAIPVTNERILHIRQQFQLHTTARHTVERKIQEKREKELRSMKREKKAPRIKVPESMLPNRYVRGELPCTIEHGGSNGKYLSWACPLENLDYEYYLPIFFDGLQCNDVIVGFIARQGVEDLLYASKGHPERIIPVIPSLVRPLRNALSKFDPEILLPVLKILQQLITCNEGVGEKLLSYAKQFLAPMSFFMDENKNTGDRIDYGQRRGNDIGEEVRKTLELLEEHGGPKALQQIKFSIPLYESCMKRPDAHHSREEALKTSNAPQRGPSSPHRR
eukprot:gene11100-12096_t